MWRIFRWLDRHPPSFYKFTAMLAGLGAVAGLGFAVGALWHPAAGVLCVFAALFALMKASMTYRFTKKPKPEPESGLPIGEASDREVVRRVRRHANTEAWRKRILWLAAHDKGDLGDRARRIVAGWEAEAAKNAKPRS